MPINHSSFVLGRRVALSYEFVGPNRLLGQIVQVTPRSMLIHLDGKCRASRFFLRDGHWRSEFGRRVSIARCQPSKSITSSDHHGAPVLTGKLGKTK